MRTTLTLDSDVAERLRQETASGKRSLKEVVNDRLRKGFGMKPTRAAVVFRVDPHDSAYRPGVERAKLNQLLDELHAEEFAGKPAGQ